MVGLDDPQGLFQPQPLSSLQQLLSSLPQIPSLCFQLVNPAANGLGKGQEWEGAAAFGGR